MEHPYKINDDDIILTLWPNECPFCHKHINPIDFGYSFERGILNLVFKCSFAFCKSLFIVKYRTASAHAGLCVPQPTFSTHIGLSKNLRRHLVLTAGIKFY